MGHLTPRLHSRVLAKPREARRGREGLDKERRDQTPREGLE